MKKAPVFHPFLFAMFPVLFLLAHNMRLFDVTVALRPMAITTCLALVGWAVLSLALKDKIKAGLVVSFSFLLLFSYESVFAWAGSFAMRLMGGYVVGMRAYVLLACAILSAIASYLFIRTHRDLHGPTNIANIMAGFLVAISLINIVSHEMGTSSSGQNNACSEIIHTNPISLQESVTLPNIYYIILDEYAGADTLKEIYQYDNSELLSYLTRKGFYVTDKSSSNYCQTVLSLASSLNLTHLDALVSQVGVDYQGFQPATAMIRDNCAFSHLRQYGYQVVSFSSGYDPTQIRDADVFIAPRRDMLLNEFESKLLDMTPLPFLLKVVGFESPLDSRRERILYTFDHIGDLSELDSPFFVFAHVMAPHSPFVFGPNGEDIDLGYDFSRWDNGAVLKQQYLDHYTGQLTFINSRVRATVDDILSSSATPPVIVLQADTGPASGLDRENPDSTNLEERFSILNAYYLPNGGDVHLYEGISPVNTFRVIFNHYLDTDYELLEDRSYFSTASHPYALIDVTDKVSSRFCIDDPE